MRHEPAVNKLKRVIAMHYTDGNCNAECADAICDCFGHEPDYAKRAAQAVLVELREPLTAVFNALDAGGWEPGRPATAQHLLRGTDLADEVLTRLGMKGQQ
jgi:hypothetical protein